MYQEGEFVLYKHTRLPIQINTRVQKCGQLVTCNCGVAVMVEDDAIVIDKCKKVNRSVDEGQKVKCIYTVRVFYLIDRKQWISNHVLYFGTKTSFYVLS